MKISTTSGSSQQNFANVGHFDLSAATVKANPFLSHFGKDRLTYNPEKRYASGIYYKKSEPYLASGSYMTYTLQAALVYGAAVKTS